MRPLRINPSSYDSDNCHHRDNENPADGLTNYALPHVMKSDVVTARGMNPIEQKQETCCQKG